MNMKSEIKEQWVNALRSGQYVQGYYKLRTVNSEDETQVQYCCSAC